jgi:broad specificity phosphatase PhoE
MTRTLVFIRHAHRNNDEPSRDNGLSEKGELQVKRLVKFVRARLDKRVPVFFTSPKKRCIQTLSPVAEDFKSEVTVDERLSEQGPNESRVHYLARIDEFLDFWKYECNELTVICSHGDFIPVLIEKLTQAKTGLKKGGYGEIEYLEGQSYLTWLVQKID